MPPKLSPAATCSHPPPPPEPSDVCSRRRATFPLTSDGLKSKLDLESVSELFEVCLVAGRDPIASGRGSDDYRGIDYVG